MTMKACESKHVGACNDDGSKWEHTCKRRHARVGDDGESKQKQIKMELWWWSDNEENNNETRDETNTKQMKYMNVRCEHTSIH